ncbi:hypothetical protein JN535_19705 [Cellulosimicrobium cellulans]|uniref:hypothetical protein n=1 Tax=Cellulosimicrobium cellulans TaxID=1710 RepID=UPI001963FFBE|nr:hypothetical protein [Cellulosimicrobium cellulans]MBN0042379.1 hypothetical protein [Cellulosimicrobium cellulans]
MVYSEGLAERIRAALGPRAPFDERKMFGGIAFLVNTHMALGVTRDDLMCGSARRARTRRWNGAGLSWRWVVAR